MLITKGTTLVLDQLVFMQLKWWAPVRDVVGNGFQWTFALAFVAVHCCLTFLLPVPGCPKYNPFLVKLDEGLFYLTCCRGYLGPGGIQDAGMYANCTGGAAGYIDRLIFGTEHIYKHPTCKVIFC
jgi:heparan-alpha-glucosaminide N-acetyltransferase